MNASNPGPDIESHYLRWLDEDLIDRFARKQPDDFFRSEVHFVEKIAPGINSVLDIGCASGHFVKLLRRYRKDFDFTGIDIVPENIERAREFYPECAFILGNALEVPLEGEFDLVNATGIMQHEPRFEDLLRRMWALSGRYMLFDAKLAGMDDHLCDLEAAFCHFQGKKLYFIIHSLDKLMNFLLELPRVKSIEAFGYASAPNDRTTIRDWRGEFASANFLLERSDEPSLSLSKISLNLPFVFP